MKRPLHVHGQRRRTPLAWLLVVLSALGNGCSQPVEPELMDSESPSTPRGAAPGAGGPVVAEPGAVFGAPADDGMAVSTPVENDGPGATETNFLTPPCGADGSRRLPDAGGAGAPADAGVPVSPADAGAPMPAVDGGGARLPC
jgi:hypothetical protein